MCCGVVFRFITGGFRAGSLSADTVMLRKVGLRELSLGSACGGVDVC